MKEVTEEPWRELQLEDLQEETTESGNQTRKATDQGASLRQHRNETRSDQGRAGNSGGQRAASRQHCLVSGTEAEGGVSVEIGILSVWEVSEGGLADSWSSHIVVSVASTCCCLRDVSRIRL